MNIKLNGQDVNFEPYYFTNNYILTNTSLTQGEYFSSYDNAGMLINLTPLYEETFLEHKNDVSTWTSGEQRIATYSCKVNGNIVESYVREIISHEPGDEFLTVEYKAVGNNSTQIRHIYYPPYSPYQNLAVMFFINFKNGPDGSFVSNFGMADPSYVSPTYTDGGFEYLDWDSVLEQAFITNCNWSDLERYPTPNPSVPLSYFPRGNCIRSFWSLLSETDIIFNGIHIGPLTPDDDTNNPSTNMGPYHDISDTVDLDAAPSWGPLDTGFIKAYLLTLTDAQNIATFMLTDNFIQNVKKLFLQPIDYIISLHFLPITIPGSTATDVTIGGVDTLVDAPQVYDNYVDVSMGSINLEEFWGSFIDYAPNTKIAIYIPFIGIKDLNTDDVMTGTLTLNYRVNVLDGDFIATIKSNTSHKLNGIIAEFQGNMLLSTPITATDYTNKIVGGFTAAMQTVGGLASGNVTGTAAGITGIVEATLSKPEFARSGNISGGAGMLGHFTPYLIKTRPKQALPKLYTKLFGKPSMIGGTVGTFDGYTEFSRVKLNGISCTENERSEIESLLKGGVFV